MSCKAWPTLRPRAERGDQKAKKHTNQILISIFREEMIENLSWDLTEQKENQSFVTRKKNE